MTPEERAQKVVHENFGPVFHVEGPVTLKAVIADAIRAAVEQEREECIKAVDAYRERIEYDFNENEALLDAIEAIRARSATSPSNNPE